MSEGELEETFRVKERGLVKGFNDGERERWDRVNEREERGLVKLQQWREREMRDVWMREKIDI